MPQTSQQDIEYVDIRTNLDHEPATFYEKWVDQSSAKHANPELVAADTLRKMYPGHSLIVSSDERLFSIFELPGVVIHSPDPQVRSERLSKVGFTLGKRNGAGELAGWLTDDINFGSYKLTWNKSDLIVYIAKISFFILHDGPEKPARDLMLAAFLYAEQPHDEVWVFNRDHWSKSKALWLQIKDASWDDIVMKEGNKKTLQKDVYGFFKSEATYKKLSIPWKRGLIMYGPPGNGKTISIKAIMKTCTELGFTPLYVKSVDFLCSEVPIQEIFAKARLMAPCALILEDLDSLITSENRSLFLNQFDGLEANNGLLIIASTNYLDRLDPSLSNRPSRFDRKFAFNDPDHQERVLYAKYWQEKLKDNEEISFPESLVEEAAELTQGFSFAHLKEAFLATLVRMTTADDDQTFPVVLKDQITTLCKELGKQIPTRTAIQKPQLEKRSDEPILLAKLPPLEDKSAQKYRATSYFSSPDISPTEFDKSHDSSSPSLAPQSTSDVLPNFPKCRSGGKVCGIGSTVRSSRLVSQGGVMHAPPSAYPQVPAMPGSLPSPGPDRLQDPMAARNVLASTSKLNISRKNPFSLESLPGEQGP